MNLKTANKHCKRLSCQYGIINVPDVIPLKYSRMGNSVILGCYTRNENTVEINKYVLAYYTHKEIIDVIRHELVHTRCYQDFGHGGHGKHFRLLCELLGIDKGTARA